MKRMLLCLLVPVVFFASCLSMPKKGDAIGNEYMYLIGKIDPGLDLKQFFNMDDEKELYLRIVLGDRLRNPESEGLIISSCLNEEYFIIAVPKKSKLFLFSTMYIPKISGRVKVELQYVYNLSMTTESNDSLVYVGDLSMSTKSDKVHVTVADGFENAKRAFKDYFKDSKGNFAVPSKRLLSGPSEVEAIRRTTTVNMIYR
jgi:hypothetical protein